MFSVQVEEGKIVLPGDRENPDSVSKRVCVRVKGSKSWLFFGEDLPHGSGITSGQDVDEATWSPQEKGLTISSSSRWLKVRPAQNASRYIREPLVQTFPLAKVTQMAGLVWERNTAGSAIKPIPFIH